MPPRPSKSSAISRRTRSRTLANLAIQPPELPSLRSRRTSAPRSVSIPSHAQSATACSTASPAVLPTSGGPDRSTERAVGEAPSESPPSPLPPPPFLNPPQPSAGFTSTELSLSRLPATQNYWFDFASGPELHRSLHSSLLSIQQSDSLDQRLLEVSDLSPDQQPAPRDMRCDRTVS